MNKIHLRECHTAVLAMGVMLVAIFCSGCPSMPTTTLPAENSVQAHTDKMWVIGDISGELADQIDTVYQNRVAYDDASTDAPIMIAGESVASLTDADKDGILRAYENLFPITVVQCTEPEVNAMLDILGQEQSFKLPDGESYAELVAIDQEEDGTVYLWTMFPPSQSVPAENPDETPAVDTPQNQLERVDLFNDWLEENGNRETDETKAYQTEANAALTAQVKAAGAELTEIAKCHKTIYNFSDSNNHYQLIFSIYACHSFDSEDSKNYDWFYVRQSGMLNASGAYSGVKNPFPNPVVFSKCGKYVGRYAMDNWMEDRTKEDGGVTLIESTPLTISSATQVTSGVDINVGGTLGYQGAGPIMTLTGGMAIRNSTSFSINDCSVTNDSTSNYHNAKWLYDFARCRQEAGFFSAELQDAPPLTRNTFQPVNQWIWRFDSSVRNDETNGKKFQSKFNVDLIQSEAKQLKLPYYAYDPSHKVVSQYEKILTVPLSYPPMLVVQHNLDFSAEAQYKAENIAVSRDWVVHSSQEWCHVDPQMGTAKTTRITITVDQNPYGINRFATLTFQTKDAAGCDIMTVSQAKY